MISTVEKWMAENDRQLNMTIWLWYNKADREHVSALKCVLCICFQDKLHSGKNFNPAFISGSKNLQMSSFKDHVASEMHQHAITLYKKSQSGGDVTVYALIAKTMDGRTV